MGVAPREKKEGRTERVKTLEINFGFKFNKTFLN
jgi:hypothetical protein